MSPGEVAGRVQRRAVVLVDDASWRRAHGLWRRAWEPEGERILRPGSLAESPLGVMTPDRAALLGPESGAAAQEVLGRADAALAGRVGLLGYPEVELEPEFDRDHFTGRRWPDQHGKLLDYRTAQYGDPKWIWELNRCQELPLLCVAWLLSGEERYARTALERMLAWLGGSSPGRGIAWSNGFEAGLRGISFALSFDALRGSKQLDADHARRILLGLWQHGRYIVQDHSFGSSANNHLVGEAAGLATIALLAPELRASDSWLRRALSWLDGESDRQILPDGTGAEQAFTYHLFVVDLLLLVVALLEARGRTVPLAIRAALERSADALALQVGPGEPDPAYGDSDDGRAFVLDGADARTAAGVAASLASCLGHGGAKRLAGRPDAASLLLFGEAGRMRFDLTEAAHAPGSGLLAGSGLVVLRRAVRRVTFDAGPLGYLAIAAHGHADALSVTISDGEQELVSDPGTGSYFGDRARRWAFRGTPFHATVSVDGEDQAVQAGPFLWREHYGCTLQHLDLERGIAIAEHDGYRLLPDPVRHRRAIVAFEDGALLVYDRLDAQAAHDYAQTWPLHPSLDVRRRSEHLIGAHTSGSPRLLLALAPGETSVQILRGEVDPLAGWWSRRLEAAEPATAIRQSCTRAGGAELAALLVSQPRPDPPDPALRLESKSGVTRIELSLDGSQRLVELDLDRRRDPVRIETSGSTQAEEVTR
jgi:hypothetical protein